jgi:carboxymethylenebutenolidase
VSAADEKTTLEVAGLEIPVEIFVPERKGPHPGLVVIHESFGLNADIRRISRRFADNGYLAGAVNLMESGPRVVCVARAMRDLRRGEGPSVEALEAAVAMLEQREDVTRVGVAGFCMGGGFALLLGCRQAVEVAGVFYGEPRPAEELARCCPIVGGYGAKDRYLGGKARKLVEKLDELGKEHDIRIYEDAGHSYMNQAGVPGLALATRPFLRVEYNEEAAEDSWRRMLEFFARYLRETEGAPAG